LQLFISEVVYNLSPFPTFADGYRDGDTGEGEFAQCRGELREGPPQPNPGTDAQCYPKGEILLPGAKSFPFSSV